MNSHFRNILFLGALLASSAAHAGALEGKWFLHRFGELRAYHGDFLNVCSGKNFTTCRTVQYGFGAQRNDHFFGETRLSIARVSDDANGSEKYTIEIYIAELPPVPKGPFTLSVDGDIFRLSDTQWKAGTTEGYNVEETISITDGALTATLINKMRSGNRLRVLYDDYNETRFQLRGFSDALDAIDKQIKPAS